MFCLFLIWMRWKTAYLLLLFVLVFSFQSWGSVIINEVMYDPGQCPDAYCEWIELYNNGSESINLSGCRLEGKELSSFIMDGYSYLVLVKDEDEFLEHFFNDSALMVASFTLTNTGKNITLTGENCTGFDYTPYTKFAKGNNKTLERNKKGEWRESIVLGGTPGRKNSVYDFSYDYSVLQISEIMADPFGDDKAFKPLGEWVEIYNSGKDPVFLEGLVLYDQEDSNELYLTKVNVDPLELCAGCYTVVYRNGDSDFDLSKIQDKVRLFTGYPVSAHTLIDEVSFANAVEGMSFSRFAEGWYQTKPTPGKENVYTEGCNWGLRLELNHSIFQKDDFSFKLLVSREYGAADNLTVRGKIEDLNGKLIREYSPWTDERITTFRSKSYSPNLKEGVYQLSFWIEGLNCDDNDLSDNNISRLFAINPKYQRASSNLSIERTYLGSDNSAEWGDQFLAKVNIYKGDETKTAIELWAEKDGKVISKRSKLNIYDPYRDYTLTLPIQLEPNCNQKISDGTATLILDGLGMREEISFEIEGVDKEVCRDYLKYVADLEKQEAKDKEESYQMLEYPAEIFPGQVFRIKLQLIGDNKEHSFVIWSYLYRGSKCYSCAAGERNSNAINFRLKENEVKQVELLMKADEGLAEGNYNLKVKLNKDNQKTDKEITTSVYLSEITQIWEEGLELLAESSVPGNHGQIIPSSKKKELAGEVKGIVIYESNSEKSKQLIPYLLLLAFGLVLLVLLRKK